MSTSWSSLSRGSRLDGGEDGEVGTAEQAHARLPPVHGDEEEPPPGLPGRVEDPRVDRASSCSFLSVRPYPGEIETECVPAVLTLSSLDSMILPLIAQPADAAVQERPPRP